MSPPHPSPSLSGLGRLIPSAGPSMLWVTITHIHVTPGPLPPLPRAGGSRRCFCWPRWAAPARPLSSGRLSAPGMDNGALCASARPRRAGPGMGLAAERRVSLLSRFKGMRGREANPAVCPGERVGLCVLAWGCGGSSPRRGDVREARPGYLPSAWQARSPGSSHARPRAPAPRV